MIVLTLTPAEAQALNMLANRLPVEEVLTGRHASAAKRVLGKLQAAREAIEKEDGE